MSEEMPSKKDVVDYLRNQQKRAEIDSKVDGVNIWVLYGAVALVAWKIFEGFDPKDWAAPLLVARLLAVSTIVKSVVSRATGLSTDGAAPLFRWPRRGEAGSQYAFFRYVLVVSPVLLMFVLGQDPIALVFTLAGLAAFALYLFEALFDRTARRSIGFRFPPAVGTRLPQFVLDVTVSALIVWYWGTAAVAGLRVASIGQVKGCVLALTLYWLLQALIRRHARIRQLNWTYLLERDLLVGSKSVPAALMEIDYHASGVELPRVFDRYFDQVGRELAELVSRVEPFIRSLSSELPVRPEHTLEYQMQHDQLLQMVDAPVARLMATFAEFRRFRRVGLPKRLHVARDSSVDAALAAVDDKQTQYELAVEKVRMQVDAALKALAEGGTHAPWAPLEPDAIARPNGSANRQ